MIYNLKTPFPIKYFVQAIYDGWGFKIGDHQTDTGATVFDLIR
jgi:hypothetical protein